MDADRSAVAKAPPKLLERAERRVGAGSTARMRAMNSEPVRQEVHVDGPSDEWESRCEQALSRRPFRLTGSSQAATDGRAFAASYHRLGASVEIVVDVVPIDADRTLLSVEGTPRQDNPLAQLMRNPATGATRRLLERVSAT